MALWMDGGLNPRHIFFFIVVMEGVSFMVTTAALALMAYHHVT